MTAALPMDPGMTDTERNVVAERINRWAERMADSRRLGNHDYARQISDWLFAAEMVLTDMQETKLADLAQAAQRADNEEMLGSGLT